MRNFSKVLLLVCLITGGFGCSKTSQRQVGVSPDLNPADSPVSPSSQPVTIAPLDGNTGGVGLPQGEVSAPLSEILRRYVQKPEDSAAGFTPPVDTGSRYQMHFKVRAYDPCGYKPCPEEPEDIETEEDLKYSLPPRP